tara:strand:+ start:194042 stop:195709 length:1668 start_codon:yes stop_codon:yes gene_type:complete
MVLKRKLPSAMATEGTKKEEVSTSTSAAPIKKETPPLAPMPTMETSSSAIPDIEKPTTKASPLSQNIPQHEEPIVSAWDEEPTTSSGWEIEGLGGSSKDDDIFGSMAEEVKSEEKPSEVLPPWQQGAVNSSAPELPSDIAAAGPRLMSEISDKSGPVGALVGIVLLVAIGFGGYTFFVDKDETTEVISRWTGSLNEVSEEIPTGETVANGSTETKTMLKPEAVVSMPENNEGSEVEFGTAELEPEQESLMEDEIEPETDLMRDVDEIVDVAQAEEKVINPFEEIRAVVTPEPKTVVEFVDVAESEVEQPINAEGVEDMPEEVGMIVELQQAITEARKEKSPEDFKVNEVDNVVDEEREALKMLSPDELDARNRELSRQLDEELAEYRKILAGEDSARPRKTTPNEFFDGNVSEEAIAGNEGVIPLPKRSSTLLSQTQAQSLYGANPQGLPVVSEPAPQADDGVRKLDDFDVSMFQVERERVRIPKNVRPSFRATNFPPIILLSTVRQKGIIAEMHEKQGILLIGESVSGWELIDVKAEYAEFSNGKRKHIVNIGR